MDCYQEQRIKPVQPGKEKIQKIYTNSTPGSFSINDIAEDSNGRLWIGSDNNGIDLFYPEEEKFVHDPFINVNIELSKASINKIFAYNDSIMIAGYVDKGLIFFDYKNHKKISYNKDNLNTGSLSEKTVRDIFIDRNGTLWIGTNGGGLNMYNRLRFKFKSLQSEEGKNNTLTENYIISICKTGSGKIFIGTRSGGLNVYDPLSGKYKIFKHDSGNPRSLAADLISYIYEDKRGTTWVGTSQGLNKFNLADETFTRYYVDKKNSKTPGRNFILTISEDKQGHLWIGTDGGGLNRFDTKTGSTGYYVHNENDSASVSSSTIMCVTVDEKGNVWAGSWGDGLNKLDIITNKFIRYRHNPYNSKSLSNDNIWCLLEDSKGSLWAGTSGGLNKLNPDGSFVHYTTADGLPNNTVWGIVEDKNNFLWVSTTQGLSRFDPENKLFTNYTIADGLPSDEFNYGVANRGSDGELVFGGVNGAIHFYPDLLPINRYIPPVVFTGFSKFYIPVELPDNITELKSIKLNYDENIFSFSFAALNYIQPEKNEYAYKLEGFHNEWIKLGNNRTITFTNLDPGNYILHVKASNNDGLWNETGASIAITIVPPLWRTWWFYTLSGLMIFSAGYILVFIRINSLKRRELEQNEFSQKLIESQEKERGRIAAELHDSLGQNILIIKNRALMGLKKLTDQKQTEQHFTEISNEASETLDEVRKIAYNLRPFHIDHFGLSEALRIMIKEIAERSSIDADLNIDHIDGIFSKEFEINIYRIVQECMNNIIKHAEADNINIEIILSDKSVRFTIKDNGKGFDAEKMFSSGPERKGLGLRGINERVRILGGDYSVSSEPGKGTTTNIKIPV